jgi:hypothetical protein
MSKPRYRAVTLDGFTIVLYLARANYLAIPHDPHSAEGARDQVVHAVGGGAADIRFTDPHVIPRARRDLDNDDDAGSEAPRASDWIRLASSIPPALWKLRVSRPTSWVPDEGARIPEVSPAVLQAARRFRSMRPFVPSLSRCLPHSLLLRSYLRACELEAMLVVGVRLFPFEAHSWVQAGDVVLTDDLERTAAYTPIAAG